MSHCGSSYNKKKDQCSISSCGITTAAEKDWQKTLPVTWGPPQNFEKIAPVHPHVITENIKPLGLYDFLIGTQEASSKVRKFKVFYFKVLV